MSKSQCQISDQIQNQKNMNKIKLSLIVITTVLGIAVLIEVINPHSLLGTVSAFVRVAALLIGAVCWYIFFKGTESKLVKTGVILLFLVATLYFFYGVSSFCQNKYYEINREAFANSRTDIEPYSCSGILMGLVFR